MEMGLNLRSMDEENSAWISWKSAPGAGFSWEEQAFAEDAGSTWPPRSYSCNFCRKEFRSAQALGGHMNIHRRDRARLRQALSLEPSSQHNQSGFLAEAQKQPVLSSFYSFSDPQASAMNISNGLSRQSFNWVPLISASDPPPNLHHPGNGLPASGQQSGVVSATSRSFSSSVVTAPSTVLSISLYSSPSVVGHVTEPEIFAATESSGSSELLESSRSEKRMDLQVGRLRSRRIRNNNNNSNLRELARVEEVEPYLDLELRLGDRPLQQHQIDSRSHGEF